MELNWISNILSYTDVIPTSWKVRDIWIRDGRRKTKQEEENENKYPT
jgi:hypothetical protein